MAQTGTIRAVSVLVLSTWLLACAGSGAGTGAQPTENGGNGQRTTPRILTASITEDPRNFWDGVNGGGGSGTRELGHLVNQYLAAVLPDGQVEPRLLERLPSIDNGDWTLGADGSMQVTYRLRADARWHDGTPFSADDLVFS